MPSSNLKISILIIIFLFLLGLSFFIYRNFFINRQVLSEKITASPPFSPVVLASPSSSPSPEPTPSPVPLKREYTIALFGDSMIDTMGEKMEYLEKSLNTRYPEIIFHLYNYGIGGQNVEEGLDRFDKPFSNRDRNYPPITELDADIIIIGSFAYNPFSPHDRDKHWVTLTKLVNEAKRTGANIYLLAEIAPLKSGFGKGPNGINWPEEIAFAHASHIIEQLENTVSLAKQLNVGLINAYLESKVDGSSGNPNYVNNNDGIHPSVLGHTFMADLIATTIKL